jgi:hypothetical protein
MIIGDKRFEVLRQRIAEGRINMAEVRELFMFAEHLIRENDQQSKALEAMLGEQSSIVVGGFCIYKAADGGAGVLDRKLNYEANTKRWKTGDIVIHDADSKEPKMLMVVLGYSRDGQVRTKYVSKARKQRVMKNYLDCLHEPERFGIQSAWGKRKEDGLNLIQGEWEYARRFNLRYPVGTLVNNVFTFTEMPIKTTGQAYLNEKGEAVIELGDCGVQCLYDVEVFEPPQS